MDRLNELLARVDNDGLQDSETYELIKLMVAELNARKDTLEFMGSQLIDVTERNAELEKRIEELTK